MLGTLATSTEREVESIIAFPGKLGGTVQIVKVRTSKDEDEECCDAVQQLGSITCHESDISCLTVSPDGRLVASCSVKVHHARNAVF